MPIYGKKNFENLLSENQLADFKETWYKASATQIIMKSLDPLRAKKIFMRKELGHTAVIFVLYFVK